MPGIPESATTSAEPRAGFRRRIVLTTFGSLGDLHPYIAVALGLQARGHETVIATSSYYRQKIEALGIGFLAVRLVSGDGRWPVLRTQCRHRLAAGPQGRAAAELRHLLDNPAYSQRASEVGVEIRQEVGVRMA